MNRIFIPVVVLVSLFVLSCDQDTMIPINPPFNYRSNYTDVDWANDGQHIVYIYGGNFERTDTPGMFIYDLADSTSRILIATEFFSGVPIPLSPSFSPDSRWIAFSWYEEIWKIKVDGDSLTQLTSSDEGGKHFPSWSPDGKRIAYSINAGKNAGIYIINPDGTGKYKIPNSGYGDPDWFPDCKKVAFHGCTPDNNCGLGITDLYNRNPVIIFPKALASGASVSPDGSRIVFSYPREGEPPKIWVINVDGTGLTQLTATGGDMPCWSPDGSKILYTNVDRKYGNIWIMNADGTEKRQFYPPVSE